MSEAVHQGLSDDSHARGQTLAGDADAPDDLAIRLLPLDAWHRAHGGRMVPFAGYEMPVQYPEGVLKEHMHCRTVSSLFDVSRIFHSFIYSHTLFSPSFSLFLFSLPFSC